MKGCFVVLCGHTVHGDGLLDRIQGKRQGALLKSGACEHHIGEDAITEGGFRRITRIENVDRACRSSNACGQIVDRRRRLLKKSEPAGRCEGMIGDYGGPLRAAELQTIRTCGHQEIAADHQIHRSRQHFRSSDRLGGRAKAQKGKDSTSLLCKPGDVGRGHAVAVEMCRHRQNGGKGGHARTADTRQKNVGRAAGRHRRHG